MGTKIKICGVTHPEDAAFAITSGADYIGMIFSPSSKRNIEVSLAVQIARVVRERGALPVGVFVDQTVEEIHYLCEQIGLQMVQLHGTKARQACLHLDPSLKVIYAVPAEEVKEVPCKAIPLYDGLNGGMGKSFNWKLFTPPKRDWFLAGGLTPHNVRKAMALLKPFAVDVSTGVEFPGIPRKDPLLVQAFIEAIRTCEENI